MAQADSNNTTSLPSTDNPTAAPTGLARRAFVTALAGGAAAAMVAPVASLASGEPDPIFALIETHREAQRAHAAACAEQSRREDILIDEGIGLCPFVTMAWQGRAIVAHTPHQIDAHHYISEKVRARAHAELNATLARYREVFGNAENEAGEIGDVAIDAFHNMISTPPTSIAGLSALLTYLSDSVADLGHLFESDTVEMFIHSLHDALLELHPAVGRA